MLLLKLLTIYLYYLCLGTDYMNNSFKMLLTNNFIPYRFLSNKTPFKIK